MKVDINNKFAPIAAFVPYGCYDKMAVCDVVMNASGVGMGKRLGDSTIPKELLKASHFCFDACYNPAKTQFLLDAEAQGCKILNGLGMSLYQGAARGLPMAILHIVHFGEKERSTIEQTMADAADEAAAGKRAEGGEA